MTDLNTRIIVDNSKHLADEGKSLPLSELLSSDDLRFKIDNSKDLADNFRSISLGQIKSILNNESVLGFDLNTRIVIDNSNASAHEDKTVLIEDVIVLVQPSEGSDYIGPLDIVLEAVVVAYGQRALSAAMLGSALYTILEDSGNTTQSFNSDAVTGDAPVAAITAFLNGANGINAVWNDQSGNGFDLLENPSNQYAWVASSQGNKPAFEAISTTNGAIMASAGNIDNGFTGFTIFSVMKRILSTEINGDTDAYLDTTLYSDTDAPYVDCSDASANEAGGDFAVQSLSSSDFIIWESAWEFGSRSVKVNGTELVSGNVYDSGGAVSGVFVNGVYQIAQQRGFDNQIGIQEHLCYSSKLSDSDRLAIRQNIAAYYGITLA